MTKNGIVDLFKKQPGDHVFLETYSKWKEFTNFLEKLKLRPYAINTERKTTLAGMSGSKVYRNPTFYTSISP